MTRILSKLFGSNRKPLPTNALEQREGSGDRSSSRRQKPRELDLQSAEYIPLPPSPSKWELDDREEKAEAYSNPALRPVFDASFKRQFTKVITLAWEVPEDLRDTLIGQEVARAYREVIQRRRKAGQLKAAAKYADEMFRAIPSHCEDRDKRRLNKILGELDKKGTPHDFSRVPVEASEQVPLFQVSAGSGWEISDSRKLEPGERPDTAFRQSWFTADGCVFVDPTGKSQLADGAPAVLRSLDRTGKPRTERRLRHDVHHVRAKPSASGIAIMDTGGSVHLYDSGLEEVLTHDLRTDPRIVDHYKSIDTNYFGDLKSHIRGIDFSMAQNAFLFTIADEAWCCSNDGKTLWGVQNRLNEGWERVVGRSQTFGVGAEVRDALARFELQLPVSPKEIKSRYKVVARQHHPDFNQGDPLATEAMKGINQAFKVLTGIDPESLSLDDSDITFFRRTEPDFTFEGSGVTLSITIQAGSPQDWIYGVSFASSGLGAYLATYSGKVIAVSETGLATRVFDVGSVPTQILDTGDFLYLLTSTRLYVLDREASLTAFLDVFEQGRLLISQSGFGLLATKTFQWFEPHGEKVGEVTTRDPIRAVFSSAGGTVVETRQHRCTISGLEVGSANEDSASPT